MTAIVRPERFGPFRRAAEAVEEVDASDFIHSLEERFGIPRQTFDRFVVFRPNRKHLAIVERDAELPAGVEIRSHELLGVGMPFFYDNMRDPRMTTAATAKFGHLATRNVIELDAQETEDFVYRREIRRAAQDLPSCEGRGYVIGRSGRLVIGLGHLRPEGDEKVILGMTPRSWQARR